MAKKRQKRCSQTQGIQKRLAAYSMTAGAVLSLGSSATLINPDASEATVVYTAVNQPISGPTGQFKGTFVTGVIFTINQNTSSTGAGTSKYASADIALGGGNIWVSAGWVYAFPSSTNIAMFAGPASAQICHYALTSIATTPSSSGNFQGAGGRFIGVRFMLSGLPHYGWIRIDVAPKCQSMTIVDYAYEDTPNTPIHTGIPAPVGGIVHDISDAGEALPKK